MASTRVRYVLWERPLVSYTLEEVKTAASRVSTRFPRRRNKVNSVHSDCSYVNNKGNPSCFVGHIMSDLGAPLPKYGNRENFGSLESLWSFTPEAADWLYDVQLIADGDPGYFEDTRGACPTWGSLIGLCQQ